MEYQPLTQANIEKVYKLFNINEPFYYIPFDYFKRGTLEDEDFDPELTLVLDDPQADYPRAALIAVNRNNNCFIKACLVDKAFRRQGIGNNMMKELIKRAKNKNISLMSYGDAIPNYWQPGVDLRHTDLLFFLKKNRFKHQETRFNLTVHLSNLKIEPLSEKKGYYFERVQPKDFENVCIFAKKNYPLHPFWAEEVKISLKIKPPTTFVAKNSIGEIIGWATHSLGIPGVFGPTGVIYRLQGQGIGGELLKWCLWDIKQNGFDICEILYVTGKTIKFYSKTVGAYIHPVFYTMHKKLKKS
ncbi:MAG: GNAT family N-acetyltransferase [Candidatus Hermodarchaeota archaeon]